MSGVSGDERSRAHDGGELSDALSALRHRGEARLDRACIAAIGVFALAAWAFAEPWLGAFALLPGVACVMILNRPAAFLLSVMAAAWAPLVWLAPNLVGTDLARTAPDAATRAAWLMPWPALVALLMIATDHVAHRTQRRATPTTAHHDTPASEDGPHPVVIVDGETFTPARTDRVVRVFLVFPALLALGVLVVQELRESLWVEASDVWWAVASGVILTLTVHTAPRLASTLWNIRRSAIRCSAGTREAPFRHLGLCLRSDAEWFALFAASSWLVISLV